MDASSKDAGVVSTVIYGTDSFRRAAEAFQEMARDGRGARVVFAGGSHEQRQQALAALTRHSAATLHQFRLPALFEERRMQTQNRLRKAFDHAAEEDALLYFEAVEAVFDHHHPDGIGHEGEAEPTTQEYFFDRVDAYPGLVVLALSRTAPLERVTAHDVHLVVRFE